MGSIRVHEFTTLDGVIDQPTWTFEYGFDPKMGEAIAACMAGCDGILLGRTTYEMFAPAWSERTAEQDPGAPFMNGTTKYVVSSTLRDPTWSPTVVVGGYDPEAIARLKNDVDGALYVSGSGTLVRAMLDDGLVDELHFFVYPVSLGAGPRLFTDGAVATKWSLQRSEAYENGVLYTSYLR